MKIPNKRKFQQIVSNYSSDVEFKDLIKLYNDCTEESISFLLNDTTLPSDNPLRLKNNLL